MFNQGSSKKRNLSNMKRILISGAYDILHPGHIRILEFAKSLGDVLFVAIDSDRKIKEEKGGNRPHHTAAEREEILLALRSVDNVVVFDSKEELENICKIFQPDVRVVGGDWRGKEIIGAEHCKEIVFFDRIEGYSTTKILQHLLWNYEY